MNQRLAFIALLSLLVVFPLQAQRGVRIGYIDMEYILSEMDSYQKASAQLEEKSKKWKEEIAAEKEKIEQLEEQFESEKPLLTASLIKEREEELAYERMKLENYQQKRFGPKGDWINQQQNLVQPIQDQVLSIVQQVASKKKYDFVFDRTSDVFMLYSEKKYDISQIVLKNLKKAERLQSAKGTEKEIGLILDDDELDELDPELQERKKQLEEKKAERARIIEERKAERAKIVEERKKAIEAKRLQKLKEKEEKRNAPENEQ
jgi:Skp family chaperone for outer membrane proteins